MLTLTFVLRIICSFIVLLLPLIFVLVFKSRKQNRPQTDPKSPSPIIPKAYPFLGHYFDLKANWNRRAVWASEILQNSPSATFLVLLPFGGRGLVTGNPANVQHILKTNFHNYQKGDQFRTVLNDLLGDGIFNADGNTWRFQRQVASHEFNTKSLRKFIETVVDTELSRRLIPILAYAAQNGAVLDFQDILQRFAFDNICQIAFGYDPGYLLPSLPPAKFAQAFEESVNISSDRFISLSWKIKRAFNIGSEKRLRQAVSEVRDFAMKLVKEKKEELKTENSIESVDLLSRFLRSGHSDEKFVTDILISFIIAGRDTTSAALTWFFWLLSGNPEAESKIIGEINEKSEMPDFEEVKDMVYTHACLCESMRLYPPVPEDTKVAVEEDVLPDGTQVAKGTTVTYHPYSMGRLATLWGSDWPDYKPERWLERDACNEKWKFVGRDAYSYPVFQAGPRICLGKEMAFMQMKRVVAGVLSRFNVVPATDPGVEPELLSYLTAKMKGGLPVRIEERVK